MKNDIHWSFNYINNEYWNNGSYSTKEEADSALEKIQIEESV